MSDKLSLRLTARSNSSDLYDKLKYVGHST